MNRLLYLLLILLPLMGCADKKQKTTTRNLRNAITGTCEEFNIAGFAYVIANEEEILDKDFNLPQNALFSNSEAILGNFAAPLVLKQMIEDSEVNKDSLLIKYITNLNNKSLKVADLFKVPANQTELSPLHSEAILSYLKQVVNSGKKGDKNNSIQQFLRQNMDIETTQSLNSKSLLNDFAKLSLYFDKENISGYISANDSIPELYPTWYTRNIIYFAGWNVLKFDGHTLFWNFYNDGSKSLLLLKVIDAGIFVAVAYNSSVIPSPFDCNKSDLLQSPFATNLLKSLFVPDNLAREKADTIRQSKWNFLFMTDLTARAKAHERMGNHKKAEALYKQYETSFPEAIPVKYVKQNVLAEIGNVPDNMDTKQYFELEKDTKVRLFGSGQLLTDPYMENHLYIFDGVELYLDMYNKKNKLLNVKDNQYMYRFNYGYSKVSGIYLSNHNIEFAIDDPHDNVYIIEIKIPWQTLNNRKPHLGEKLGLNMYIMDNDLNEKQRKSVLAWTSKNPNANYNNPSKWGTLILAGKPLPEEYKKAYCAKATGPVKVDGKIDSVWNQTGAIPIDTLAEGSITGKLDNSGWMKTLWDEQAIYFLYYVTDNEKNIAGINTVDKGWIENVETGEVIYKMTDPSITAFFPTFEIDKVLALKAGKYVLKYNSNEGHSVEKWYGKPPQNGLYGAILYKNIE